jgi:hypothetical protein
MVALHDVGHLRPSALRVVNPKVVVRSKGFVTPPVAARPTSWAAIISRLDRRRRPNASPAMQRDEW